MKLSEQWLREWVNPQLSLAQLGEQLTMAGLEVEAIEPVAGEFSKVIIGEILAAKPHEDAAKLQVCQVTTGESEPLQIVCGAANARAGLKVAVAMVGATLPNGVNIKEAKLRGITSQGMLCSASELGLAESAVGILELASNAPIGTDFRVWMQLDDQTIELSITPNRGDCLSIAGIAREVAVLNRTPLTMPDFKVIEPQGSDVFPVTVIAQDQCPHYVGRVIKNIEPGVKSPLWMQERLRRSGLKSISAVVDIANYVLLELGQPLHTFDLTKLATGITVRMSEVDERLTLLDGQEVTLKANTLLITDANGPQAIAGVMGGLDSAVTDKTTDIFLESAFFNPLIIAGRARQYGLHTDAAHRFERGVDPALQIKAIERASELLLACVGGTAGPLIVVANEAALPKPKTILLRRARIERLLGFSFTDVEVEATLAILGMTVAAQADGWQVTSPSHRFDIAIEVDLIEELARIKGYDQIPLRYPLTQNRLQPASERRVELKRLRSLLVDSGYQEAITYSFVDPQLQQQIIPEQTAITLVNPMSVEMSAMRLSLWPGLINALQYNQNRQQARVRFFETGLCFYTAAEAMVQESRLAGIVCGNVLPEQWATVARSVDFFDVKADVSAMLQLTQHADAYRFEPATHPTLHPGQCAAIKCADEIIGYVGKIHPQLEQSLALNQPVFLYELKLDKILPASIPTFRLLSKFPSIRRDLAIVVAQEISAQAINNTIKSAAGELLKQTQVFDVYQGAGVKEGFKSLAISITLQHDARTLIDQDIAATINNIVNKLQDEFNAILRD